MPIEEVMTPIQSLMAGLIDYAGLFPPAKLDMGPTVSNYAEYLASDEEWMLGRLIVPVSRLDEFERAASGLIPTDADAMPWRISALLPPIADADLDSLFGQIDAFNARHLVVSSGLAVIDTIEIRASDTHEIDSLLRVLPDQARAFVEIPVGGDPRGVVAALAGTGCAAKIRTGSVNPEEIPRVADVARFICACARADVAFKATAGLHHPIRAEHNLTYEADSPRGVMHGFLNMFLASCWAFTEGCSASAMESVLDERSAGGFVFDETGVKWKQNHITNAQIAAAREHFALSFGSCSFTEPIEDLRDLHLL
ncbi:MAG: hypothetical protein ACYTF7_00905 [Planctomycetota bacterium]|jgi:hypothetical protein